MCTYSHEVVHLEKGSTPCYPSQESAAEPAAAHAGRVSRDTEPPQVSSSLKLEYGKLEKPGGQVAARQAHKAASHLSLHIYLTLTTLCRRYAPSMESTLVAGQMFSSKDIFCMFWHFALEILGMQNFSCIKPHSHYHKRFQHLPSSKKI